ncbi:hypothetical protein D3C71_1976440 [compost metagenome]
MVFNWSVVCLYCARLTSEISTSFALSCVIPSTAGGTVFWTALKRSRSEAALQMSNISLFVLSKFSMSCARFCSVGSAMKRARFILMR